MNFSPLFLVAAYPTWQPIVGSLLLVCGLLGLLAIVHPRWFAALSSQGSQWVDSSRMLAFLDRRFDVDRLLLRHTRLFGSLILGSVTLLALRWFAR